MVDATVAKKVTAAPNSANKVKRPEPILKEAEPPRSETLLLKSQQKGKSSELVPKTGGLFYSQQESVLLSASVAARRAT